MLVERARFALLSSLALALGSPGCGSPASEAAGGAGGAPVGCPSDVPQDGDACQGASACHYPDMCCEDTIATCASGRFQVSPGVCIGKTPAPQCPADPPTPGALCTAGCMGLVCTYGACPGSSAPALTAHCLDHAWTLAATCNDGIPLGGVCGGSADGGVCADGLACCYPCGVPGCNSTCTTPCSAGDPGCSGGCVPVP